MRSGPTAVLTGVGLAVAGLSVPDDLLMPSSGESGGFDPAVELSTRGMRHKDRATRLALCAAGPALHDAGLLSEPRPRTRTQVAMALGPRLAVVVSTNLGNLDTVCEFTDIIEQHTVTGLSPVRMPDGSSNVTASRIAIEYGLRGPNITLCNGTTSGLDALFWARNLIVMGRADVAVVVGVEPDTEPVARFHRNSGARSWLDGAAAVIVESDRHAARRGVTPRAVLSGYGRAADLPSAVAQARDTDPRPIDMYLATHPAGRHAPQDSGPRHSPVVDLTVRLGRCCGALGVLQCVAAVARLERDDGTTVLAIAGGTADDPDNEGELAGAAALLLTRPTPEKPWKNSPYASDHHDPEKEPHRV